MKPTLRCSGLDRLLSCHGSLTLERLVAPRISDEGDEGTAIHYKIARTLTSVMGAQGDCGAPGPCRVNPASEWIVSYCVREVADMLPVDWSLEVEVALAYAFDSFSLSGHIDALGMSPDATEAVAWDWKSGYVAVDPAEFNEQALGYLVLLKRAYPSLRKATFIIVQPRNDEESGFERVSRVTVEWKGPVDFMTKNFVARVQRALAYNMHVESGVKQCRFCPAYLQCPAIDAEIKLMKAVLTEEFIANVKAQPDDAKLGDAVCSAKTLEAPFESARALVKERIALNGAVTASDGTSITVNKTKGSYEVLDVDAFHKELVSVIDPKRLPHCTKPSMTRIKDEIAEFQKIPKTGKAAITAETLFDAKLRPYTQQGEREMLVFN